MSKLLSLLSTIMLTPFLFELTVDNSQDNLLQALGLSETRSEELFEVTKKALLTHRTKSATLKEISKHCNTSNELVGSIVMLSSMVPGGI